MIGEVRILADRPGLFAKARTLAGSSAPGRVMKTARGVAPPVPKRRTAEQQPRRKKETEEAARSGPPASREKLGP
jgi:hypothetical protein